MYADEVTDSMKAAINETNRRRMLQLQYNEDHGIDPQTIRKKGLRHPRTGLVVGRGELGGPSPQRGPPT